MTVPSRKKQRSLSNTILRIHIRTFGNQQFDDFLVSIISRPMQRSTSIPPISLCIHIHAFIQFRLYASKIASRDSIVNRISEGGCGQ